MTAKNFATGLWEQNPRWPRQQQGEIELERCATNWIFRCLSFVDYERLNDTPRVQETT